jgi:predicted DNA binding CopG/RHH family protein
MKIHELIWPMEELMNNRISDPAIPQTDSIQELARFWDTHEITDFEDQLEVVEEPVFQREAIVNIRLEPQEAEVIKSLAESRGMRQADLIREWVLEKLAVS